MSVLDYFAGITDEELSGIQIYYPPNNESQSPISPPSNAVERTDLFDEISDADCIALSQSIEDGRYDHRELAVAQRIMVDRMQSVCRFPC